MGAKLGTIGALTALGLAAAAIYARFKAPDGAAPSSTRLTIGGETLTVPASYLTGDPGGAPQMAALLPDFRPAGSGAELTARTDLDQRFDRLVFLRPVPADPLLDPAERTARLYQRFLARETSPAPDGLVARAFAADSPFRGERLVYALPEGREFAARCPTGGNAPTPEVCVSLFRDGGLDVEVRYSGTWLPRAREIVKAARILIDAWRR